MATADDILKMIKEKEVKFLDLRFTDPKGKQQHVTFDLSMVDKEFLEEGTMFDGSSIAGWKAINESDMLLMPDLDTAVVDPFFAQTTMSIVCDVHEPSTGERYQRCPRSIAKAAEKYMQSAGVGDVAYFGPEAEFFIFDDVRFEQGMQQGYYFLDNTEGPYNSGRSYETGNLGHRPGIKGGYFPVRRLHADLQICRPPGGRVLRQVGNVHAETDQGRQRIRHARPPVNLEVGQAAVRGQRLCGPVGDVPLLHRRHHQARQGAERVYQPADQFLQAADPGL
jgi:glutamine synthetase